MKNIECIECGFSCKLNYLGTHTKLRHNKSLKEYFDQHLKKELDGLCIICGAETKFKGLGEIAFGYTKTCSSKCANAMRNERLLEKYGVKNNFQLDHIKEKSRKTMLEKYGVENTSQLEETKKKKIDTCLKNHGVKHPGQSKDIMKSIRETNLIKYGVENPMYNEEIAQRAAINGGGRAKSRYYQTKFGDRILIQGSYEMLFVEFCEKNNIRIEDGPFLYYRFDGEPHKYFVDFKINVGGKIKLVEIKSTYWYNVHREQNDAKIIAAKKYCEENGLKYYFIINDNNKKHLNLKKFNVVLEDL
jgi:hypothetical protein